MGFYPESLKTPIVGQTAEHIYLAGYEEYSESVVQMVNRKICRETLAVRNISFQTENGYQRTRADAQVRPPPNESSRTRSPSFTFPALLASSRAIGIEAADVLPYRSKLI